MSSFGVKDNIRCKDLKISSYTSDKIENDNTECTCHNRQFISGQNQPDD